MPKTVSTDRVRQGPWGRPVLVVLVVSLVLAVIVWAGVELFGESIDPPAQDAPAQTTTG